MTIEQGTDRRNDDTAAALIVAAYEQLFAEKRHYDQWSVMWGGIVVVFAGALIAAMAAVSHEKYAIQFFVRLIPAAVVFALLHGWRMMYERNRMWGEAANEAIRDIELKYGVRGAGVVFRDCALTGQVILKNTDSAGQKLIINGRAIEPRTERARVPRRRRLLPSVHDVVTHLVWLTAITAILAALRP